MTDKTLEETLFPNPIQPTKLALEDTIQFHCHKGVACFNVCCKQIDITLTPYDILRLKNRLSLTSSEFLAQYTVPFDMDGQGMPGVKLRTAEDNLGCPFLQETGCSLYTDRPTACRYYALGLLSMRRENTTEDEDAYFLVQEDHCLGHQEPRTIRIQDYRQEQGLEHYDEMNRPWRQIILKRRSSGSVVGQPSARSYQFFFLASYNLDNFRAFVQSPGFSNVYDLTNETLTQLNTDDEALLTFGCRLLKQVLFGEMTITLKKSGK